MTWPAPYTLRLCLALALALPLLAAPLLAGEPTPELRLPADVTYATADGSPGPVVFSHTTHVPLADTRCDACHPGTFSILQPTGRITHEEMEAGKRCGACHNGTKAASVKDECGHCHQMGGGS
jgi:c(7)-type cytochrome triheme protein